MLLTVTFIWLFTKAPLDETMQIFQEKLYAIPDPPTPLSEYVSRAACWEGFSRLHSAGRVSLDTVQ